MSRIILPFLILLLVSSCGFKESNTEPDYIAPLMGKYTVSVRNKISDSAFVNRDIEWTVTKYSAKSVNIKHRQINTLDPSSTGVYQPTGSFEHTFENVAVFPPNLMDFRGEVKDWVFNNKKQNTGIVFSVIIVNNRLRGVLTESNMPSTEHTETELDMVKL